MRTPLAIALGIAVGAAAAGVVFVGAQRMDAGVGPLQVGAPPPATPAPRAVAAPTERAQPGPPASRPTTPDYGPRPADPQAIYRCRTKTGTQYSNHPCTGGRIVDESSAVTGYDTTPSDRLSRLVAEGRGAADGPLQPVYRSPMRPSVGRGDCEGMRRQMMDLDAAMRQPNDLKRMDELRAVRQDVRTSMARLHC